MISKYIHNIKKKLQNKVQNLKKVTLKIKKLTFISINSKLSVNALPLMNIDSIIIINKINTYYSLQFLF